MRYIKIQDMLCALYCQAGLIGALPGSGRGASIITRRTVENEYPWLQQETAEYAGAVTYLRDVLQPFNQRLCAHFANTVPNGQTLEVTGSHYVFFTEPSLTARTIRRFVQQ